MGDRTEHSDSMADKNDLIRNITCFLGAGRLSEGGKQQPGGSVSVATREPGAVLDKVGPGARDRPSSQWQPGSDDRHTVGQSFHPEGVHHWKSNNHWAGQKAQKE